MSNINGQAWTGLRVVRAFLGRRTRQSPSPTLRAGIGTHIGYPFSAGFGAATLRQPG
jgi:hypothetical protein